MFKIRTKKVIASTTAIIFVLFFASSVLAAVSYTPLEPGAFRSITGSDTVSFSNLSAFFGQIFNYGIAVAGVLAVVMIIWGGIEYMTTESWGGKSDAKKKIEDALIGLGLALVSWLILYTINPCLVQFNGGDKCKTVNTFITPTSSMDINHINKNV